MPRFLVAVATTLAALAVTSEARAFTFAPDDPLVGQTVRFTATDEECPETATCTWSFGDGTPVTGATAEREFSSPGTKTVTLTATTPPEGEGEPVVRESSRDVPVHRPPVASFVASIDGLAVSFDSTSSDPDGDRLRYEWDFGDGAGSSEANPTHTYARDGDYRVELRVDDRRGGRSVSRYVIKARARPVPPPQPDGGPAPPQPPQPTVVVAGPKNPGPVRRPRTTSRLLRPTPKIAFKGLRRGGRSRFDLFSVSGPIGARVAVRCRGRDCARSQRLRLTRRTVRLRRLEGRYMRAGTMVELRVTMPGKYGRFFRVTLRRDGAPVRKDRCLTRTTGRITRCPAR